MAIDVSEIGIFYHATPLDAAMGLNDMGCPSSGLHELQGDKKGIWSVRVSGNWRMTFRFESGNAYVIGYQDYH